MFVCVLHGCIFISHVKDARVATVHWMTACSTGCWRKWRTGPIRFGGGVVAGAPLHHTAPAEPACLEISPKSAQENVSRSETCGSKWLLLVSYDNMTWFGIRVALCVVETRWAAEAPTVGPFLGSSWRCKGGETDFGPMGSWAGHSCRSRSLSRYAQVKSGHRFGSGYVGIVVWGHWGCLVMSVTWASKASSLSDQRCEGCCVCIPKIAKGHKESWLERNGISKAFEIAKVGNWRTIFNHFHPCSCSFIHFQYALAWGPFL